MSDHTFVEKLTEILVRLKSITPAEGKQLIIDFKESSKPQFDDFLLEEGLIEESDLLQALSQYFQVPSVDVVGYFFDHELLRKFPKLFLVSNVIIPMDVDQNIMTVVASRPDNPELLDLIGDHVSYDIQFRVGLARDIIDSIREYYDKSLTDIPMDETVQEEREMEDEERALESEDDESYDDELQEDVDDVINIWETEFDDYE